MTKFMLPPVITDLAIARDRVRRHYSVPGLAFKPGILGHKDVAVIDVRSDSQPSGSEAAA